MTEATCRRCGKDPAEGFAMIGDDRYCHEGEDPTCYMAQQWENSGTTSAIMATLAGQASPLPGIGSLGDWDDQLKSWVIKRTEDWIVSVTPMIFNDRVLLTHVAEYPYTWTAGWCYDKGGAAILAAVAYDPDKDAEPVGYKKLAADRRHG